MQNPQLELDTIAQTFNANPEQALSAFIGVFRNPRFHDTPEQFIQSVNNHLTKRGVFIDPAQLDLHARLWYESHEDTSIWS